MSGGDGEIKDFYSVMGVKSDCTSSELRAAYKKLAMRWHPDRWSASGNAKVAEESKKKFQAIQEAYSVLSDENKRFLYDAGVYEDDDDDEMGDFLDEMAVMMNENKGQVSGSESFEQLQDLFMEMFESDLNSFHTPAKPSSNKRNRSDFHGGGTVRKEEIAEPSFMSSSPFQTQSFSMGGQDDYDVGNGKGRRRTGRKHPVNCSVSVEH